MIDQWRSIRSMAFVRSTERDSIAIEIASSIVDVDDAISTFVRRARARERRRRSTTHGRARAVATDGRSGRSGWSRSRSVDRVVRPSIDAIDRESRFESIDMI